MARKRVTPLITDFDNIPSEALVPEDEQPYEIPDHWKWVRLGSICNLLSGRDEPLSECNSEGSGIPYVMGASNLSDAGLTIERWIAHPKVVSEAGDLLISVKGTVGKLYTQQEPELNLSRQIMAIQPGDLLEVSYLLQHVNEALQVIQQQAVGLIPGISRAVLLSLPLPLPPFDEQKSIVEKLQATNQKIDDVLERLDQFLDQAPQQRAAIIQAGVTGALTKAWREEHHVSWPASVSTGLFDFVTSGSRGWSKYYADTGAAFLRMGNLTSNSIDLNLSDLQKVELPEKVEGRRSRVLGGDLLVSITADVGHVALIRNLEQDAYINQHLALARPAAHVVPEFLAWYLRSPIGQVNIRTKQRGATKSGLGLDDIRSLAVDLPEPNEQAEIVRCLNLELERSDQAISRVEEARALLVAAKITARSRALRGYT